MRARVWVLVLFATASQALAAETPLRPGRWEITTQMDFGGREMPPGMPFAQPMTSVSCLSEEEAKQSASPIPMPKQQGSCKISDYKKDGNRVRFTATCDTGTMDFDATIASPEAYSGTMTSRAQDPSQKFAMKFKGKRTAQPCTQAELDADEGR